MYSDNSQLVDGLKALGVLYTPHIEEAFLVVDRKNFVTEESRKYAYVDEALSIGHGQTISQPYTVAFMLELLAPSPGERILDVGSGSGWSTALLAHIVGKAGHVFGVEIMPKLVKFGQKNLNIYNFSQADIRQANDELGLKKEAPFDKILVSAGCNKVPEELVAQLHTGGVMVIPINDALWKITKLPNNKIGTEVYAGFVFVPLID